MLPVELVELIFSKIKDKKTILSLRLTNKYFYNIFKNVIDYENEKKYIFNSDSYQTFNLKTNFIENEIIFKFPCYYIYKEYNSSKIVTKKIKSSLFKLEKTDWVGYTCTGYKKKTYNIYDEKTENYEIIYPMLHNCSLM